MLKFHTSELQTMLNSTANHTKSKSISRGESATILNPSIFTYIHTLKTFFTLTPNA